MSDRAVTSQPQLRSSLIADAAESAGPRVSAAVKHAGSAPFALLDAAKPARRPPDLPIADLLRECHLTAEAVRDITPDVLDGRLRALAVALTGADRLRRALVASALKNTAQLPAAIVTAAFDTRDNEAEQTARSRSRSRTTSPRRSPSTGRPCSTRPRRSSGAMWS
jgi:hypothetical protein